MAYPREGSDSYWKQWKSFLPATERSRLRQKDCNGKPDGACTLRRHAQVRVKYFVWRSIAVFIP